VTETPAWPGDWLRGVLEVCVLRVLADGPTYGYAIAQRLADAGLGVLKGGTLYPLLARFETAGLVAVEWRAGAGGPGRKYYVLTDDGRRAWREQAERWTAFAHLTTRLVTSDLDTAPSTTAPSTIVPSPTTPSTTAPHGASSTPAPTTGPLPARNGARP